MRKQKKLRALALAATTLSVIGGATSATAQEGPLMVRIAELQIDPAQLVAYKAILKEQQEAAVRLEPGVLMLHSVAITSAPTRIRLLELYASRSAYESHLRTPHFVKYKTTTESMVKALELIETTPILLCAKSNGTLGEPILCR